MAGPHDALFKAAFEQPDNAAALVRRCLSDELAATIDWSTMELMPGSFVDDELRSRHCDLVFRVASLAGPVVVYVLLEHQSTNDRHMSLRVLVYLGRLWMRWAQEHPAELLPFVIPLVVSNVPEGWRSPTRLLELFTLATLAARPELGRHLPDFEILVDDLARTDDDELSSRALASFAKVALWLLRDGRVDARLRETMRKWVGLLDELPFPALATIVRYFARVTNDPMIWEEFRANLHELAPRAEGDVMTLAEQWEAKGEARGEAKGRAEGEAKGEAKVLTKQLTLKFGELPELYRARLASASIPELDVWAERLLFVDSLEQVFAP